MPVLLTVRPDDPDPEVIQRAAGLLRDGLVVAYPTDTLYGLAVDPRNADAVNRLFALKGRPESSALTLIAADVAQAEAAGAFGDAARRLATHWWPGPLTIVVPVNGPIVPAALAGGNTVGIRVPDHLVATSLAAALGFCITATSANRSGAPAASTAGAVAEALAQVDAIIDAGPSRGGAPSTIVSAAADNLTLVRDGAVPWERVLRSFH